MTLRDWQWIAAAALMMAACGAPDESSDGDAGLGPFADAGAALPDETSDVAGGWSFAATRAGQSQPYLVCSVSVGGGIFDIGCPEGDVPRVVHEGCQQVRDDLHWHGAVSVLKQGHLDGMLDQLVEYEGDQCVTYGYTTGAPYPLPAFAEMQATQTEPVGLDGFLRHLGGRWDWTLDDTRSQGMACEVHVAVELTGVLLTASCPDGDLVPISPECNQQEALVVTAHAKPGSLEGEIARETRHTGSCGDLPPTSSQPVAVFDASRK